MSVKPSGIVERLLAERIGLDPSSVGEGLIARGVHARMVVLGLRSRADYERALLGRGDEVKGEGLAGQAAGMTLDPNRVQVLIHGSGGANDRSFHLQDSAAVKKTPDGG